MHDTEKNDRRSQVARDRSALSLARASWWGWKVLATVALVILLGVAAWLWRPPGSGLAPWQVEGIKVVEDVQASRTPLDHESPEPDKLVAWLQQRSAPVLATLPDALAARRAVGCKMWEWRGLRMAMICFDLGESKSAQLVSTWHGGLKGAPPLGHMIYGRSGEWSTATWSEGGLACLLLTDAGGAALRELLADAGGIDAPILRLACAALELEEAFLP